MGWEITTDAGAVLARGPTELQAWLALFNPLGSSRLVDGPMFLFFVRAMRESGLNAEEIPDG